MRMSVNKIDKITFKVLWGTAC